DIVSSLAKARKLCIVVNSACCATRNRSDNFTCLNFIMEEQQDKNLQGDPVPLVISARGDIVMDRIPEERMSTDTASPQEDASSKPEEQENSKVSATAPKVQFSPQDSTNGSTVAFRHNLWAQVGSHPPPFEFKESEVSIPGKRRAQGPLKKRLSPPPVAMRESESYHHPPPALLWSRTSSSYYPNSSVVRPLLRQGTSSLLQSNAKLPPLFQSNPSLGQSLISAPLVKTPQVLGEIAKRNLLSSNSTFQPSQDMFTPANPSGTTQLPPIVTNKLSTSDFAFSGGAATTKEWTVAEQQEYDYLWSGTPMLPTVKKQDKTFASLRTPKTAKQAAGPRQYHDILHPFSAKSRLVASTGHPARRPQFSPMVSFTKKKPVQNQMLKPPPKTLKAAPKPAPTVPPPAAAIRKTSSRIIRAPLTSDSDWTPPPTRKRKTTIRMKAKVPKKIKSVKKTTVTQMNQGDNDKPSFFIDVPTTKRPCKCGATKCLKLYCECFHSSKFCDPNLCRCTQCMNLEEHNSVNEPQGARAAAILSIVARRPLAFAVGGRKAITDKDGCRCQNSR
ncbi:MAG: hypothetical protein SGILL_009265, partial [Bacillariaceae sp.]